jgi:hypothetical protein
MSEKEHGDKEIPVDPTVGGSEPGEGDPGWIGGGGPASTIDDMDPTDEESHRPDTDHSIT